MACRQASNVRSSLLQWPRRQLDAILASRRAAQGSKVPCRRHRRRTTGYLAFKLGIKAVWQHDKPHASSCFCWLSSVRRPVCLVVALLGCAAFRRVTHALVGNCGGEPRDE